ncbi:MAG: hypothetical protein IKP35_04255 [Alphaproteobacteria bacterium]|nr:hypothetical protein [Alphaproteobacteria bacterium]MBR6010596.1 hypothetical protein [Alphaproteobacteria bacterium]
MEDIIILIVLVVCTLSTVISLFLIISTNKNVREMTKTLTFQYNLIVKIQNLLKNKMSVNDTTDKAEIIYQDLLQDLIPIMASIDIMPRTTSEHPLWRALGGIMDEYAKNPFVLEKLRRAIKLDTNISHNVSHYLNRANMFLQHMSATDTDGILSTTFTDGLLGQSLTFFAQAQALASTDK